MTGVEHRILDILEITVISYVWPIKKIFGKQML